MSDYLRDRLVAAVGDHYLIEDELGRGGMAAVFRALDLRLNRRVAIKVLPPELAFNPSVRSRFLREAQMAAGLTHPNIVPIYMVDEVDGLVFFAMALVDGESLAKRIARVKSMPIEEVRAVACAVADALDYAHRQGVVHRDIKPDNILLDRQSGQAKVTDFGIARAAAEESRLTVTGMAVGTPAYMSPEQAMGEREVDGRSDIYSLGIVTYQMLAGETPFKATNTPAMLMKHVSEPPPPLRSRRVDVPLSLATAVERALAKRPEDRWRSGAEMRDAMLERTMARVYPVPPPPAHLSRASSEFVEAPQEHVAARPLVQVAPAGLSPRERKEWYREQRRSLRDAWREGVDARHPQQNMQQRIASFRRKLAGSLSTVAVLAGVNLFFTHGPPWAVIPIFFISLGLLRRMGDLWWSEGISLRQLIFSPNRALPSSTPASAHVDRGESLSALVPVEILHGPHGMEVRRAAGNRQIVTDLLARMKPTEREMLPADLEGTVKALVERVASVATTMHRLDAEASGANLGSLDQRVEVLKKEVTNPEQERRLALLERQRVTMRDLLERRSALLAQLESASLALENLKLDLVRLRSAGVSSALDDVTSATREARAVSRDIGHLLEAVDEVRKL